MWFFLSSDPFLWCIVWFCEHLNRSYGGHLSCCPHIVTLVFPVPFLCVLVSWSRKLNQQKHCNLANIFAVSTNPTGWLLGLVKPQQRCKAERETVVGGGLDCCTLGDFISFMYFYLIFFKPLFPWSCMVALCLRLCCCCKVAQDFWYGMCWSCPWCAYLCFLPFLCWQ